jgi:hypothetical protein
MLLLFWKFYICILLKYDTNLDEVTEHFISVYLRLFLWVKILQKLVIAPSMLTAHCSQTACYLLIWDTITTLGFCTLYTMLWLPELGRGMSYGPNHWRSCSKAFGKDFMWHWNIYTQSLMVSYWDHIKSPMYGESVSTWGLLLPPLLLPSRPCWHMSTSTSLQPYA